MTPDTITVSAGIISVNGRPLLRFANSNVAGIWLMRNGWKVILSDAQTYSFSK